MRLAALPVGAVVFAGGRKANATALPEVHARAHALRRALQRFWCGAEYPPTWLPLVEERLRDVPRVSGGRRRETRNAVAGREEAEAVWRALSGREKYSFHRWH